MVKYSFPERHKHSLDIIKIIINITHILYSFYLVLVFAINRKKFFEKKGQNFPKVTITFLLTSLINGIFRDKLPLLFSLIIITFLTLVSYIFKDINRNFYFELSKKKRFFQSLLIVLISIFGTAFNQILHLSHLSNERAGILMILFVIDTIFFCPFKFSQDFFFLIVIPNFFLLSPIMTGVESNYHQASVTLVTLICFIFLYNQILRHPLKFFGEFEFVRNIKKAVFYRDFEPDGTL